MGSTNSPQLDVVSEHATLCRAGQITLKEYFDRMLDDARASADMALRDSRPTYRK